MLFNSEVHLATFSGPEDQEVALQYKWFFKPWNMGVADWCDVLCLSSVASPRTVGIAPSCKKSFSSSPVLHRPRLEQQSDTKWFHTLAAFTDCGWNISIKNEVIHLLLCSLMLGVHVQVYVGLYSQQQANVTNSFWHYASGPSVACREKTMA